MPTTTIDAPGDSPVMNWIKDHLDYPHADYCLIWPFGRFNGYGTFVRERRKNFAHRFICEIKNGPPPTSAHQAAHSCNRGRDGCVNPHHLSWKTQAENLADSSTRGRKRFKVTLEQALQIRNIKGLEPVEATAVRYGITECTVRDIQDGRTWKNTDRRVARAFRDSEIQRIRALEATTTAKKLAAEYGVTATTIYHIWNRSTWAHVPEAECVLPSGVL